MTFEFMTKRWFALSAVFLLFYNHPAFSDSALTRLHSFGSSGSSAANPYTRLIQASDGLLYGTTAAGGDAGQGTLFRLNPDGSGFTLLKSFANGGADAQRPFGALVEATDGVLYGTTEAGGQSGLGTVFKLAKDGSGYSVLMSFTGNSDGAAPEAALIEGSDGFLYGTTSGGGTNDNGVVFRISKDGSAFTTLVQFRGTNGANPECELLEASDGMLYGTTSTSSTNTLLGTVFRLQKDGTGFATLAQFLNTNLIKTNGAAPLARLVEGTNGMLYGTTSAGGTKGMGTIYRLKKDGTGFAMLYHFGTNNTFDGRSPLGNLTLASDGSLYGTTFDGGTNSSGTVFRIAQDGTSYMQIISLAGPQGVAAGLVEATNGMLYGTTQLGGPSGDGTVFRLQKDGTGFAVSKSFSASGEDGNSPYSAPLWVGTNQLYGTTRLGGDAGLGTVYSVRFDGADYQLIANLGMGPGPIDPESSLLELTPGTLVGTSRLGGNTNAGTLFALDPSGSNVTVIYSPPDSSTGQEFRSGLIQATDGLLYGTSVSGGATGQGTVFRLGVDGSNYTVLKNFAFGATGPGANPVQSLLEGTDGNLYGTTFFGGKTNRGVVFGMSKDGSTYTVLKSFGTPASDGEGPMSPLIEASDHLLYGTTYGGGTTNNGGTLCCINKDGTGFHVVLFFAAVGADGRHPCGRLVEWANGSLYGTTERGGINDQGTLFRVNKDGSGYAVLAQFGGSLGSYPRGGVSSGPDGALYVTTAQGGDMGSGTVLRYGPAFGDIADVQLVGSLPIITGIGLPGISYTLERTAQLGPVASWTAVLSTNAPPMGRFSVADQAAASGAVPQMFYRFKR
jgi:uncharacterized repeat protein (TIGR03803 family)